MTPTPRRVPDRPSDAAAVRLDDYLHREHGVSLGKRAALAALEAAALSMRVATDEAVADALGRMDALLDPKLGLLTVGPETATVRGCHADLAAIRAALQAAALPAAELWCLHIQGPDDVHAAPSRAHAEKAAELFNASFPQTPDVPCRAVAAQWPHSPESHAEDVAEFITAWMANPMTQPDEISKVAIAIRHAADNGGANEGQCYEWSRKLGRLESATIPAPIDSAPVYSKPIDATPAAINPQPVDMDANAWAELHRLRAESTESTTGKPWRHLAAELRGENATLARKLAEANEWAAKWESQANSAVKGMQLIQRSADRARAQLDEANRRLAEVEGLLQDMLDLRDASQRCELHPKGELVIVKAARAALQPKEL